MANIIRTGNVSGGAVLISKTISSNGTYYASADNANGYSSVDVDLASVEYPYLFELNQSQGGNWINSGVDMTAIDNLIFMQEVSGVAGIIKQIAKEDIAVYSGGPDVYTNIFTASQIGKDFNIRIYNDYLYISFGLVGASSNKVKCYNGIITFGPDT